MTLERVWLYTNFDCNLQCSYCLSSSHPKALRREFTLGDYHSLVDETVALGIPELCITGGEPFLLPDMEQRLDYALQRGLRVTVLTNGLLLTGSRLQGMAHLSGAPLTLQISLDGDRPELHDPYRGSGTWSRTVDAIHRVHDAGFTVAIGATETPLNSEYLGDLTRFVGDLGVQAQDFFVRPLTKRGLSAEGLELQAGDLAPELTVTAEGCYWHPQTGGEALRLTQQPLPLQLALDVMQTTYDVLVAGGPIPGRYRCA